jgi:3-phosphoshikimate 1-carboxyvinyltransferase
MALPDLIEIVPLPKPVRAEITVPGSKSITNRALILAALTEGETTLTGALWSEDTQVMVDCLRELGFMLEVASDPNESCNRRLTVYGRGGSVLPGGTENQPLELFVGNAGTAARFLTAFLCLGKGVYRLEGVARMHQRPQAALFDALRELGYRIDSANNKLPATIHGGGPRPARCRVSVAESSQFASALLLGAQQGRWSVEIVGENADESPYVTMTEKLLKVFPKQGGSFQIEPDASSGSYFVAARQPATVLEYSEQLGVEVPTTYFNPVTVRDWPSSGWQMDENFSDVMHRVAGWTALRLEPQRGGAGLNLVQKDRLGGEQILRGLQSALGTPWTISRQRDLGDSIMTAIVIAPFSPHAIRFTDLGRLRVQECERVFALRTELTKCGAKVLESDDTLEVFPSTIHGAEVETYNDHRMAMCFAILGLKVPGIKIKNPACVKKTFPNFFQKLAATPPGGLGVEVRDAVTSRRLAPTDLFAE